MFQIYCHGTPNKVHQTCMFWTENKCRNSSDVCRFIHSYYCPDGEQCRKKFCSMHHTRGNGKKAVLANKVGFVDGYAYVEDCVRKSLDTYVLSLGTNEKEYYPCISCIL